MYLLSFSNVIFQVRGHQEFKTFSPAEKSKVMKNMKSVMPRSEELKKLLKAQYEAEYDDYRQMLEIDRQRQVALAEEQRKIKLQQEGKICCKICIFFSSFMKFKRLSIFSVK